MRLSEKSTSMCLLAFREIYSQTSQKVLPTTGMYLSNLKGKHI